MTDTNVIDLLISITKNILVDIHEDYLMFLQDMFPYLEKYLVTDYLPRLTDRIKSVMKQDTSNAQNESGLQQNIYSHYDKRAMQSLKLQKAMSKTAKYQAFDIAPTVADCKIYYFVQVSES